MEAAMKREDGAAGLAARRRRELVEQLERSGFELWRAPEGFWAIRIKRDDSASEDSKPSKSQER
jgi:hypothetical protein